MQDDGKKGLYATGLGAHSESDELHEARHMRVVRPPLPPLTSRSWPISAIWFSSCSACRLCSAL